MPLKRMKMETLLIDILDHHTLDPEFAPLEVKYNGRLLFSHDDIFAQFAHNYSSYSVIVSTVYRATSAFFVNLWGSYVRETAAQLQRQLNAMTAEYNPINNYDLTEHYADCTKRATHTDTTTPTGGTRTESTIKKSGLGSIGDGENSDHTESTITPLENTKTETQHTYQNDQTATVDETTLTGGEVRQHVLRKYGNVGVTQNSQMITAEMELRRISILRDYVREFVCRYCFSVGGSEHENHYI